MSDIVMKVHVLIYFLRQCQSPFTSVVMSYDVKYLGQAACRMEDFLPVSWVSDPHVSEILVLHHVTSLHVHKHKKDTQINTFTHRHTHTNKQSHQTYMQTVTYMHAQRQCTIWTKISNL